MSHARKMLPEMVGTIALIFWKNLGAWYVSNPSMLSVPDIPNSFCGSRH